MDIDFRQIPGTSALFLDYLHDYRKVEGFYAGDPRDPATMLRLAAAVRTRTYPRPAVADILAEQNRAFGAAEAVLANIERLRAPETVAVLTGQQTGLFGGPLYTLYKALSAVRLARELEAGGQPAVPVFWLTSEDHDLEEAGRIDLLGPESRLLTLRLKIRPGAGSMPADLALDGSVTDLLAAVASALPETEFKAALLADMAECFPPGATLATAFARWQARLLGPLGLIQVDGADPRLKVLLRDLFERELVEAPAGAGRVAEAGRALVARGYHAQIQAREDGVNLFLLEDGRRWLHRDGEGFRVRDLPDVRSPEEILEAVRRRPERFSPNVALRPLAQDTLFPTVAYVAGPAEVAYFAQLKGLYDRHGVPMPAVFPRASATLIEARIARLMERHRLALGDLWPDGEAVANRVIRAALHPAFEAKVAEAREAIFAAFKDLETLMVGVDPTLVPTVGLAAGAVKNQIETLERKMVQALKRRNDEIRGQVLRVRESLVPGGRLQERVLSPLPFLAKHGPSLVPRLLEALAVPGCSHQLFYL